MIHTLRDVTYITYRAHNVRIVRIYYARCDIHHMCPLSQCRICPYCTPVYVRPPLYNKSI